MKLTTWPQQDENWVAHYRSSIAYKHVPPAALEARERELLNAVRSAGLPAAELFGDAAELAAEDAAELATAEEVVRRSEGAGLRSALREIGQSLTGIAAVTVLLMLARTGWSVDVEVKDIVVVASIAVMVVGWSVGRALFVAGRQEAMLGVLAATGVVAAAGLARAFRLPSDTVLAGGVLVPALGAGLLVPGVVLLVVASRMPPQVLRQDWDDVEWLRRFRGGLRTRLVPAATAMGHVREVEQTLSAGSVSAFEEYGHPLVLARELAAADRTARSRRWWLATVGGAGTTLVLAVAVLVLGSGGAWTIPLGVALLLSVIITLVISWRSRPWAQRR